MLRILALLAISFAEDEFELNTQTTSGKITHKLFQSYDGVNWEERGTIQLSVFGDKRRKPLISIKNTKFEKEKIKHNGNYYVGVYHEAENNFLISSSIPSCYVIGSDLQDIISVFVDQENGSIIGINYKTESKNCERTTTALRLQTMAEVVNTKEALKPYFAMPKPEDIQEQQSFFRKYVRVI